MLTGMIKKPGTLAFLLLWSALFSGPSGAAAQAEEAGSPADMVTCTETTLKIDASNAKTENLIREIGDKCGIKVVVFGEAFEDKTIGVKFQQLPIRKGIERVLRIANLPNFVLHLDNNPVAPRIVEIDIMGKKGGERQLTAGTRPAPGAPTPPGTPAVAVPSPKPPATAPGPTAPAMPQQKLQADKQAPPMDPKANEQAQEEFIRVMDAMMKAQEAGEEPDPAEVLRIFKNVVPPEVRDQIPPEVLKELEDLQKNPQQIPGMK